jgi:hypothetical protein
MTYLVTKTWKVEGEVTPEEAVQAVSDFTSAFSRGADKVSQDIKVRRYDFEPSNWKDEHPDEEWDTGKNSTVANVTQTEWHVVVQ